MTAKFDPYKILRIGKTASMEQVKIAYKRAVKVHHPDVKGGDAEKFDLATRAYRILSDPNLREKYDNTGQISENRIADESKMVTDELLSLFNTLITQNIVFKPVDLIGIMKDAVENEIGNIVDNIKEGQSRARALEKLKKRMKTKKGHPNQLNQSIDYHIRQTNESLAKIEQRTHILELVLAELDFYECLPETASHQIFYNTVTSTRGI